MDRDSKKWFVYFKDHHEGPFTADEIESKLSQGEVTPQHYVWAEGMEGWKVMEQIPDLSSLIRGTGAFVLRPEMALDLEEIAPHKEEATPEPVLEASPETVEPVAVEPMEVSEPEAPVAEPEVAEAIAPADEIAQESTQVMEAPMALSEEAPSENPTHSPIHSKRKVPLLIRFMLLVAFGTGIAAAYVQGYLDPILNQPQVKAAMETASQTILPYTQMLMERLPALKKWVSPVPRLPDVDPEEYEVLKEVAGAPISEKGPLVALAVSRMNLQNPFFYIVSNLPLGAAFEVHVEGEEDTLLNQLRFVSTMRVKMNESAQATDTLRYLDGRLIPRGNYRITVYEAANQPEAIQRFLEKAPTIGTSGKKVLFSTTYFLGGAKDETYFTRLKAYHDKIRTRAIAELNELKQFSGTVISQFSSSMSEYQKASDGKRTSTKKKQWEKAHAQWVTLQNQLDQTFALWNDQNLEAGYFFSNLYQMTREAGDAVSQVHALQHQLIVGKSTSELEVQLKEKIDQAQEKLSQMKSKIDETSKLPLRPSGLPGRLTESQGEKTS